MVTAKSLAKRFKVSERHIQKTAKSLGISKTKGRYLFTKDDITLIKSSLQGTTQRNEPKRTTNIEDLKKAVHRLKNEVKILEDLIQNL